MGRKLGIEFIQVSVNRSRLPADSVVVYIKLSSPIKTFKELEELGLDFIDRPKFVTAEQLMRLIETLTQG